MSDPSGSGVWIRDVQQNDLAVFFDHQLDPEATWMAAFPARRRDAFMAHWAKIRADDTVVVQTVVAEGEVAGNLVSRGAGRAAPSRLLARPPLLGSGDRDECAGNVS